MYTQCSATLNTNTRWQCDASLLCCRSNNASAQSLPTSVISGSINPRLYLWRHFDEIGIIRRMHNDTKRDVDCIVCIRCMVKDEFSVNVKMRMNVIEFNVKIKKEFK
eukprot:TRINITY_DN762_c0_g1_i1.p1 TRINITY_DN762_c0_g1~~TRINITY_DN762_c0_g1_i1.p1  ORF type:complete len:107 (+),score=6.14 TRINITY_DN762_c0_g1_i1:71-391(+)